VKSESERISFIEFVRKSQRWLGRRREVFVVVMIVVVVVVVVSSKRSHRFVLREREKPIERERL